MNNKIYIFEYVVRKKNNNKKANSLSNKVFETREISKAIVKSVFAFIC